MDKRLTQGVLALVAGGTLGAALGAGLAPLLLWPLFLTIPIGTVFGAGLTFVCCDLAAARAGIKRAWKESTAHLHWPRIWSPAARKVGGENELRHGWTCLRIEAQQLFLTLLLLGSYAITGIFPAATILYWYPAEWTGGWFVVGMLLFIWAAFSVIAIASVLIFGGMRFGFILWAYRFPRLGTGRGWWYKHSTRWSVNGALAGLDSLTEKLEEYNLFCILTLAIFWLRTMIPALKNTVRLSYRYIHSDWSVMLATAAAAGATIGGFLGSFNLWWSLSGGVIALAAGAFKYYVAAPLLGVVPK